MRNVLMIAILLLAQPLLYGGLLNRIARIFHSKHEAVEGGIPPFRPKTGALRAAHPEIYEGRRSQETPAPSDPLIYNSTPEPALLTVPDYDVPAAQPATEYSTTAVPESELTFEPEQASAPADAAPVLQPALPVAAVAGSKRGARTAGPRLRRKSK